MGPARQEQPAGGAPLGCGGGYGFGPAAGDEIRHAGADPGDVPPRGSAARRIGRATLLFAMLPDLKLVVRLQEIDNRLAGLSREIAELPKHIAEIEKKLTSHERKLEADRAALAANHKERKKCEGEIQIQEQKISKLKDQMSGAKTNEVFHAFQHEIDFCQKEIRKSEDRILELMGEAESLDKNVNTAEVALKAEKAQVEADKALTRERTAVDERAASELNAERSGIVVTVAPAMY